MVEGLIETFSGVRFVGGDGTTLEDDLVILLRKYATAFPEFLGKGNKSKIVVGMDPRPSGPQISKVLRDFLGCTVSDLDVCATAEIEESVRYKRADGGIMISGSHNEERENGLKFLGPTGMILAPDDADTLIKRKNEIDISGLSTNPAYVFRDQYSKVRYVEFLIDLIGGPKVFEKIIDYMHKKELKVYVDPNGGSGVRILNMLSYRGLPLQKVNFTEGKFEREIIPNNETLDYLAARMQGNAFAFGFDCDADRVEMVLPKGSSFSKRTKANVVSGQYVLGMLIKAVLSSMENPQEQTIVCNDATSYLVREVVESHRAKWVEESVGEVNTVLGMEKYGSPIGGEGSNGGVIVSPSKCRDGILGMLLTLKHVATEDKPLDAILCGLPPYYTLRNDDLSIDPRYSYDFKDAMKNYLKEIGFRTFSETGDATGGLKAFHRDDWSWVWFRGSKTKPGQYRVFADSRLLKKAQELLKIGEQAFYEVKERLAA